MPIDTNVVREFGVPGADVLDRWAGAVSDVDEHSLEAAIQWAELEAEVNDDADTLFNYVGNQLYPPEKLAQVRLCSRVLIEKILELATMDYTEFVVLDPSTSSVMEHRDVAQETTDNAPEVCRALCLSRELGVRCMFARDAIGVGEDSTTFGFYEFYEFIGAAEWKRGDNNKIRIGWSTLSLMYVLTHPHYPNGKCPPKANPDGDWGERVAYYAAKHLNETYVGIRTKVEYTGPKPKYTEQDLGLQLT